MYQAVLFAHLILAIMIVGIVLLQKSEGTNLNPSDTQFGARRAPPHPLSRMTAILAALFMGTSLTLTLIGQRAHKPASILDAPAVQAPAAPTDKPADAPPPVPAAPAVPLNK